MDKIFTVGDEIDFRKSESNPSWSRGKIIGFNVSGGEMCVNIFPEGETSRSGDIWHTLENIRHPKPPAKPQPTKERTEVTFLSEFAGKCIEYKFWATKKIPLDKFESVSKAIESVLNDEPK